MKIDHKMLDGDFEIDEKKGGSKRRRRHRRNKFLVMLIPLFVAIVLILMIGFVSYKTGLIEGFGGSNEEADRQSLFSITKDNEVGIIYNDSYIETTALKINDEIYVPFDFVHENLNPDFYYNEEEQQLLYSTPTETMSWKSDDNALYIEDNVCYLALSFVKQYTNLYTDEFSDGLDRVIIKNDWGEASMATVAKKTELRTGESTKRAWIEKLAKGDSVKIISANDAWSYVRTNGGYIGYVQNKRLKDVHTEEEHEVTDVAPFDYTSIHYDGKVILGWHQVTNPAANAYLGSVVSKTSGMNVVAPTWLSLRDTDGAFTDISSSDYVTQAHNMGLKVWVVADNFNFSEFSPTADTYTVLSNTEKRQQLAEYLVASVVNCGADGLNIDFEQLSGETGQHFAQFIRELSIECRKSGIVLSVDNYVPMAYSKLYHREVQGKVADYVIIMGYDEYNAASEEAGPVASIGFVRDGIDKTLEEVDASKVINAVPFYTRIWTSGDGALSSQAVGMSDAAQFIANHALSMEWDETSGYNYATGSDSKNTYQVWLEDEQSIALKLNYMKEKNLAGFACWRLGFEKSEVWQDIAAYAAE
ncbi:MAG: hypothetical protein IJ815_03175 [Lachnospiraceae bacterium]|nr:hypothetical protein [Lachnospiraceae bacterium]